MPDQTDTAVRIFYFPAQNFLPFPHWLHTPGLTAYPMFLIPSVDFPPLFTARVTSPCPPLFLFMVCWNNLS